MTKENDESKELDDMLKNQNNSIDVNLDLWNEFIPENELSVEDSFFFYPYHKHNEYVAKKLFNNYLLFQENKIKVAKEIVDINQLVLNENIYLNNKSQVIKNKNYEIAFESFIRRMDIYTDVRGEMPIKDEHDLIEYQKYLIRKVPSSLIWEISIVLRHQDEMYKRTNVMFKKRVNFDNMD
ncbi:MAG: hypothetical protein WC758_05915 [Candidatus Woesearchaeota archaeon]|jgi:hypothetical protein